MRHGCPGSSPRPWGTHAGHQLAAPDGRFIPTPVGNAAAAAPDRTRPAVHPHARGERGTVTVTHDGNGGSSPRPWGTLVTRRPMSARQRFIPTPVGNARRRRCARSAGPVHPHARGERAGLLRRIARTAGSSPRPWGTLALDLTGLPVERFIPTPVGNARACCRRAASAAVHPHARGERAGAAAAGSCSAGSSPRPWGTPARAAGPRRLRRFIPTPVGNAEASPKLAFCFSVHPHARGERRLDLPLVALDARFIPTPVGNACPASPRRQPDPVHPHARGERHRIEAVCLALAGSSPRPWGTRIAVSCRAVPCRFIPTPVGNAVVSRCRPKLLAVHPHARGERPSPARRYPP